MVENAFEQPIDKPIEYQYRLLKETPRNWQLMKDRSAIITLIKDKLHSRSLFLKGSQPAAEFMPGEVQADAIEFYCNPSVVLNSQSTLFIALNRQVEIDFALTDQIEPGRYLLTPLQARVAVMQRAFPRYALKDGEVIASNFRISTNEIAPNNTKLKITTDVLFPEFEKSHQTELNGVKIMLANDPRLPHELTERPIANIEEMMVGGKPHFVQPVMIHENKKDVLLALILFPVPKNGMSDDLRSRVDDLAGELLQSVINANASFVKDKQKVINISEGGVALQIDSAILKKNLPNRDWLTFDLLFKLHAPIRFYGNIRHISRSDDAWLIGIDLSGQGHSGYRKGSKEVFTSMIHKLLQG